MAMASTWSPAPTTSLRSWPGLPSPSSPRVSSVSLFAFLFLCLYLVCFSQTSISFLFFVFRFFSSWIFLALWCWPDVVLGCQEAQAVQARLPRLPQGQEGHGSLPLLKEDKKTNDSSLLLSSSSFPSFCHPVKMCLSSCLFSRHVPPLDSTDDEDEDGEFVSSDMEKEKISNGRHFLSPATAVHAEARANDSFEIACDTCNLWFHGSCVGITEEEAKAVEEYKCPNCQLQPASSFLSFCSLACHCCC